MDKCDLCHDKDGKPEVLFLHGQCHLSAPLQAIMKGDVLVLQCFLPDCGREIARFRIAEQLHH